MSALYRLVYTSRNLLKGTEAETKAEVEQILDASRRNNARAEITGALMFNGGAFAQVLEGPQYGVEATFERIQRDVRHGEVTVLECGPVAERSFENWSMAFVGQSARGRVLWSELAAKSGFDLTRMNADAVFTMLHGLVLDEEGEPAAGAETTAIHTLAKRSASADRRARTVEPGPALAERAHQDTAEASTGPASTNEDRRGCSATALKIMKAALADERERTTELRGSLDELRVSVAEARAESDALRAERDLWMQRARVLAAVLCDDPAEVRSAARLAETSTLDGSVAVLRKAPRQAVA